MVRVARAFIGAASAAFVVLTATGAAAAEGARNGNLPKGAAAAISRTLGAENAPYRIREIDDGLQMLNTPHRLSAVFSADGVEVRSDATRVGLSLESYGRGQAAVLVPKVLPSGSMNRVEYRRTGVTEWYTNGPLGLEQGFTVWERPGGDSANPVTLSFALFGDAPAVLDGSDRVTLGSSLRYSGLVTVDATGRELPSAMELRPGQLLIHVHDTDARYPITIDPIFEQVKLTASDSAGFDHFGLAIAISSDGNTIVAGAEAADIGANASQGAVYVFVKPAGGWGTATQTAKLAASDGAANDLLGESVAISNDTIVAGARNANSDRGAAYVFVKPSGGWANGTETAKLTASDGITNENFGLRVAIAGDTIAAAVGQPIITRTGRVYVFVKPTSRGGGERHGDGSAVRRQPFAVRSAGQCPGDVDRRKHARRGLAEYACCRREPG